MGGMGFEFHPQTGMKLKFLDSSHMRGDGCGLPPVEILTSGPAPIFNLIDDDSFGTNPEDDFSLQRLLLTHCTVEQHAIFRQLLTHLQGH